MKALILYGGKGTRLHPFSLEYQKKDLLVNGRKVCDRQIDFLWDNNVLNITEIGGMGGTAGDCKSFLKKKGIHIILYGDTLYDNNLKKVVEYHKKKKATCTISVAKTDVPKEKGIILLGKNNQIIEFVEKPKRPKSDWSFGGIIVCDKRILKFFPKKKKVDWGRDIFPKIRESFYGFKVPKGSYIDIGTFEGYAKAIKYYRGKERRKKRK